MTRSLTPTVFESPIGPVVAVADRSIRCMLRTTAVCFLLGVGFVGATIAFVGMGRHRLATHQEIDWPIFVMAAVFAMCGWICWAIIFVRIRQMLDGRIRFRAGPGGIDLAQPGFPQWKRLFLSYPIHHFVLSWNEIAKWYPRVTYVNGVASSRYVVFETVRNTYVSADLDFFSGDENFIVNKISKAAAMATPKIPRTADTPAARPSLGGSSTNGRSGRNAEAHVMNDILPPFSTADDDPQAHVESFISQISNGWVEIEFQEDTALWRIDVEAPNSFRDVPIKLETAVFTMPTGALIGLWLRLYDIPERPYFVHRILCFEDPVSSKWLRAIAATGVLIVRLTTTMRDSTLLLRPPVDSGRLSSLLELSDEHNRRLDCLDSTAALDQFNDVFDESLRSHFNVGKAWLAVHQSLA